MRKRRLSLRRRSWVWCLVVVVAEEVAEAGGWDAVDSVVVGPELGPGGG